MNFCNNSCCYETNCYSGGTIPINIAGYHKVCAIHFQSMYALNKLICAYCESTCKVTLDMLPNIENYQILDFQPKNEIYLKPEACPSCNSYLTNPESAWLRDCGHVHCIHCANSCHPPQALYHPMTEACPNCNLYLPSPENAWLRDCGHVHCIHCASRCHPPQSLDYAPVQVPFICQNCNGEALEIQLECKHMGCLDCYGTNFCKECKKNTANKQCRHCKKVIENPDSIFYRKCNHVHCDSCAASCQNSQNVVNSSIPICPNCNGRFKEFTLKCKHQGCLDCYNKNNCKKCKESIQVCPNCNENSLLVELDCSHIGCCVCINSANCRSCIQKKDNAYFSHPKKCENCQKSGISYKFKCGHNGCSLCSSNSECYACGQAKKCVNCQRTSVGLARKECPHLICELCYNGSKCKECFKHCNKCAQILNINEFTKGDLMCKKCANHTSQYLCLFCEKTYEIVYKQDCLHNLCIKCYIHGYCVICHNAKRKPK